MSDLFRYNIKKLSSSEGFNSEHQMESFIYNNPEILGQLMDEEGNPISPAIIQQVFTQKDEERKGRIDLMALVSKADGSPLLKIIELKPDAKKEDFTQLQDYLIGLNDDNKYKENFIEFIKEKSKIEDDAVAINCYKNPLGIFMVSNFEPDLITTINEWNKNIDINSPIDLYKLLQFKTKESTYVVLDKILETTPRIRKKRADFSWTDFANYFDEINIEDIFFIDKKYTNEDDIEFIITNQRKLVSLTSETIKLMRRKDYFTRSKRFGSNPENLSGFKDPEYLATEYFPKIIWDYPPFKKIFSYEREIEDILNLKVSVTNLVQLVLLANEINQSGWVWSKKVIHKNSKKNYRYYRDILKNKM